MLKTPSLWVPKGTEVGFQAGSKSVTFGGPQRESSILSGKSGDPERTEPPNFGRDDLEMNHESAHTGCSSTAHHFQADDDNIESI